MVRLRTLHPRNNNELIFVHVASTILPRSARKQCAHLWTSSRPNLQFFLFTELAYRGSQNVFNFFLPLPEIARATQNLCFYFRPVQLPRYWTQSIFIAEKFLLACVVVFSRFRSPRHAGPGKGFTL